MRKETDSPEPATPAGATRSASSPRKRETVEEAVARERAFPTLLDELGPETIARIQREAAQYPEVMGRLPHEVKAEAAMKKSATAQDAPEQTAPATEERSASSPRRRETVEEAIARTRNMPSFLEEIGPEGVARIQREAAKYPEVWGRLPPIKQKKRR